MTVEASPGPTASLAHSLVAAGLADPGRLHRWRTEPALLERYGVHASDVDLEALADFAGLAEKIRHNQCRDDLPLTFRLLRLSGLEIDLFRHYAPRSIERRREGLTSVVHRIDGLASFVEGWAPEDDSLRCLVRDVLRHEHALAVLRATVVEAVASDNLSPGPHRPPMHNGRILVGRLTCDPAQVAAVLRARDPDLGEIERAPHTFVYQRASNGRLRILEVDQGIGNLLLAVDGRTSVARIAQRLLGDDASVDALSSVLDQLVKVGLVGWNQSGDGDASYPR
jgi:hypothetical protein